MTWKTLQLYVLRNGQWRGLDVPVEPPPPVEEPDVPTPPAPGTWVWESTAVEGGGFQNALAVSPFTDSSGRRPYIIGADVSGAHRSVDKGAHWIPCNAGSLGSSARVAGIMWSDATAGKVFLAEDGGIHMSTDYGLTWAKQSAVPDWDANNKAAEPAGSPWPEHPRQTGYVMAQDNSGGTKHVWCGTLTQGLMRSTNNFSTFAATAMVGYPIRSIALDPNDRDTLYVAVNRGSAAQNGMWKVTNARGAMTATKMTTYPGVVNNVSTNPIGPEEVIAVNQNGTTRVYVAGHESGVFRYTPSTNTWVALNTGLAINGSATYRSICHDPTNPATLYVGNWHPSSRRAIWQSTNGGVSWEQVSAPVAGQIVVDYTVFGGTRRSILADIPYHQFAQLGDWVPSMIAIDPDVPSRILVCGRGGAWWGSVGTNDVRTWRPSVSGLMVTVNMSLAADDVTDGRVLMGNMDYTNFYSADAMNTARQSKSSGSPSIGDTVAFDMGPASGNTRAYYGASVAKQPGGTGGIWSTDTPENWTGPHWVEETAGAFDMDVPAIGVGRTAGGTRVILASVSNPAGGTVGGLWRKLGATWTQMRSGTNPFALSTTAAASNMGVIRFRRNSPTVYALDNDGVWRSTDAGATWVRIYGGVSATYGTYNGLELDLTDATKVYVSAGGTLRRIDNANTTTGTGTTTTTTLWTGSAGNVAIRANGSEMFLNIRDGRIMRTTLFKTAGSQAAASWVNVASTVVQRSTGNIRSMVVTPGGVVITADNGSGAWRGYRA